MEKKVIKGGKIKVVRAFEYDVEFGKNKARDYILQKYGYQEEENEF
jgi:hypothetical protein